MELKQQKKHKSKDIFLERLKQQHYLERKKEIEELKKRLNLLQQEIKCYR